MDKFSHSTDINAVVSRHVETVVLMSRAGTERMIHALNARLDADPMEVLENMRSAVDGFVLDAEQFDDMTMLCLEYKGNNSKKKG